MIIVLQPLCKPRFSILLTPVFPTTRRFTSILRQLGRKPSGLYLDFPRFISTDPERYNSLMAWIAPQKQAFPYGASSNEMQGIIRNTISIGFPFGDAPIFSLMEKYSKGTINRVAQTAFILFSTFLDLRPVLDASD
jgi:hypothetical protein